MTVKSAKLTYYIPHSTSLKDKRQVCRSIIDRTRQRFNVSVAEVGTQDLCQTLTIGIAVVSGETAHAQQVFDEVIRYMDEYSGVEIIEVEVN